MLKVNLDKCLYCYEPGTVRKCSDRWGGCNLYCIRCRSLWVPNEGDLIEVEDDDE